MNVQYAAKMRHMRTSEDIADTWLRARLRWERRLRRYMELKDWPTAAMWRALDRLHEATRLVDSLEERIGSVEEAAAEAWWVNRAEEQMNA